MSEQLDFAEREDVKELAERIKVLIPGVQDLGTYMEAGALALAQAAITSGLNPFLGEIWVLRKGRAADPCKGFSIKPGIRGARRAARNQAAAWGFVPPYYRPMFRTPTDFEGKLMGAKANDAAVACDLELLLPLEHPWYKDAGGERYIVTGLGIQRSGGHSQMAPFQAARKRAEEDALKLAFDLPVYGEDPDEMEAPTIQDLYPAGSQPEAPAPATPAEDPGTPVIGPMPDFTQCGPNFWNNMTADLVKAGLIPSKEWLVGRFRRMGVEAVTESNAQALVDQALEKFGEQGHTEPADIIKEDPPAEPQNVGDQQVDTVTGEVLGPARPLDPAGVTAIVQAKLKENREKYGEEKVQGTQLALYQSVIGQLTKDPGEEQDLLFYLVFSQEADGLTRGEMGAFFAWCLDPNRVDGSYVLNQWAIDEARMIINMLEERKAQALRVQQEVADQEAERQARIAEVEANAEEIPLPESMEDPEVLEADEIHFTDPPEEDPEVLEEQEEPEEEQEHEPSDN